MNNFKHESVSEELLAGYVDGELKESDREQVENWLTEFPNLRELLEDQAAFSQKNREFTNSIAPPQPTAREWNELYLRISGSTTPPVRDQKLKKYISMIAMFTASCFVVATSIALFYGNLNIQKQTISETTWQLDRDDDIIRVASIEDIDILSLPENLASSLVVGKHPLGNQKLGILSVKNVEFLGMGSDEEGRIPEVNLSLADNNLILWAPAPVEPPK